MSLRRCQYAGFAFTVFLAAGCKGHAPGGAEQSLAEVTVAKPILDKVTQFEYFTGRVTAIPTVEIRARVNGYLHDIFFKDGHEVKKDDKLFEIDRRPYKAEVDRVQAQLERSTAAVKTANAELSRQEQLLSQRATSRADYDRAAGLAGEAAGALKGAEASLEKAKLDYEFTLVTAPITGLISNANVDRGNLVVADKTLLTTIVGVDPIYVEFNVDERTVLDVQEAIRQKKSKSAGKGEAPVWISLTTDGAKFPHEGKIDFIDNRLQTSTGTLKIRGLFANPKLEGSEQRRFSAGLFVRVKVSVSSASPRLLVVDRAIDSDLDRKFVLVVNEQKKVERRPVTLGPMHGDLRVVDPVIMVKTEKGLRPAKEGEKGVPSLTENDQVIVRGLQLVAPGAAVKTVEAMMTGDRDAEE